MLARRSPTHSSGSTRVASRSKRTSRAGCPLLHARRSRRSRVPGGEASCPQRHPLGRVPVSGRADHGQPRPGRPEEGGLGLRPADRAVDPRGVRPASARTARGARRARGARARRARAARRRRTRGRRGRALRGLRRDCSAPPSRPRRSSWPASSRFRSSISRRRCRTSSASPSPPTTRRNGRRRRRRPRCPTSPTCAARSGLAGRSSSRRRAATTCCSQALREPGRRCSRGGFRACCPPLTDAEIVEVTRIHSVAGLLAAERPLVTDAAVPRAAPQLLDGGDRRRRPRAASGRGEPRAPRRPAARRAAGVPAARARGASPAARGRRRRDRARRRPSALPGPLPARRDDEPLSLRRARRSGSGVLVLGAAPRRLPRQALPRAARPLRPRRHGAACACRGARGRPVGGVRAGARARRRGARAARGRGSRGGRARRTRCSIAPSSGCRSRAAAVRASRASRARPPSLAACDAVLPEHVAEALAYRAPRELMPA